MNKTMLIYNPRDGRTTQLTKKGAKQEEIVPGPNEVAVQAEFSDIASCSPSQVNPKN
jgi:hypothetical protein